MVTLQVDLSKIPTTAPKERDKEDKKKQTVNLLKKTYKLQQLLYASKQYGILVIFQWLDASGKDWVCKSVFGQLNPLGIDFVSRKAPTEEEKLHDYLRRLHAKLPARGMIQVFNRSYYEDILVPTVLKTHDKKDIKKRYDQINWFEQYMKENKIKVIKCFFAVSEEVEKERMQERLENPEKFRKHNDSDRDTLELRSKYIKVYEKILTKCNDPEWHYIPADTNRSKNYAVAKVLYEELRSLDLERPELKTGRSLDEYLENVEEIDDIDELKKKLTNSKNKE